MGMNIDLNTKSFVFFDNSYFKTTEWCTAYIIALALHGRTTIKFFSRKQRMVCQNTLSKHVAGTLVKLTERLAGGECRLLFERAPQPETRTRPFYSARRPMQHEL